MSGSILGDIDSIISDYVEMYDLMVHDLQWINHIKLNDVVYYEAALFNVTQDGFRQATNKAPDEFKYALLRFMGATRINFSCYNYDGCENWEEREYCNEPGFDWSPDMLNISPSDPRWKWSNYPSFYHIWWDAEYKHSLDQEDLLTSKKCQEYSKKLLNVAKKYGLNMKPIF